MCGWAAPAGSCDPDGVVLAVTDADHPFITLDLDLAQAESAKSAYPRYVDDQPLVSGVLAVQANDASATISAAAQGLK